MIYWDNAATTYPKPAAVQRAMDRALTEAGANPGRGGYPMSLRAARILLDCREQAALLCGEQDPARVILTPGCTASLNVVLQGLLRGGGRAVISDLEHNAVVRPLHALSPSQPVYDVVPVEPGDPEETVRRFAAAIRPDTRVICCTCASNVSGLCPPVRQIGRLAGQAGIPFVCDGAQAAGHRPMTPDEVPADYLCLPGHKGLYGPMGTGLLVCRTQPAFPPLTQGGTGTASADFVQPHELPEGYESGTVNVPGFAGLAAGIRFVRQQGEALPRRQAALMREMYRILRRMPGVVLYTPEPDEEYVPVLCCNLGAWPSEQAARLLARQGLAVRAGLHCAPLAHRKYGTLARGMVRFCPSAFTTREQMYRSCKIIEECARKALQSEK